MRRGAAACLLAGTVITCLDILVIGAADAALQSCEPVVGELVSAEGSVQLQRTSGAAWEAVSIGTKLCDNDTLRTEANSRAAVALVNEAVFRIDQNTAVHLSDIAPEPEEKSFVQLLVGALQSFSRKPRELAVDTPYLNATIEGTEFVIRVAQNESQLTVFEGTVRATNDQGEAAVTSGQMVVAQAGKAPERRIVVRPRDAANWSIYYPPVLAALGGAAPPSDLPPAMADAVRMAAQNNAAGALETMDRVPAGQRDSRYYLYRASFLLAAGQVDAAGAAIDQALSLDPNNALAYAQRSIIDVARNDNEQALSNSARAVELAPDSAAALIARSYALQATFQLGEARQVLEHAVAANPNDALAHARLAELWMMVGYRDRARAEAEKAVELAPNLERAQVVLGFAALVEIRTGPAKEAFQKAIALDTDDPLPHLGLGLATIRQGDLEGGRRQIEIAVGLDPQNSLLRSYLGKSYYEEKRDDISGQQLSIAEELDPNDPTPYLYDAIRKQSENRPVEALRDIQKSIELNDNRAAYRGRLQLDEDRAARGASLAQVYKDLGFDQLGVNEASKSLALAPDDAAAHRFLSDSLVGSGSREISRVSEQLQAQMLQDININPVQPSLSETNLNVVSLGGPTSAGFNEFTPLFERNRAKLDVTGGYGTDDTWTGEGVVSGVYNWLSLSAGAFHYETDGWRINQEAKHDIQNVFAQAAITPELNVQAEYRHRDTHFGNLAFEFAPLPFFYDNDTDFEDHVARVGLRWSPAPHSDVLLSYIHKKRETVQNSIIEIAPGTFLGLNLPLVEQDTDQFEGQYIFKRERVNVVAGGGKTQIDSHLIQEITINGGLVAGPFESRPEAEDKRGYVYANINFPDPVTWTFGVNYTKYEDQTFGANAVKETDPKAGVQWSVLPGLLFRAAYIETVKPVLVTNQTLEPTQIAGFNQFFDDANGTESRYYGAAIDWQVLPTLAVGVEATHRDIAEPFVFPTLVIDDANDNNYRGYAYWTPTNRIAVRVAYTSDKWKRESEAFSIASDSQFPVKMDTITVPLNVTYFHPSGFFAGAGVTYVDQEVRKYDRPAVLGPPFPQGKEQFTTVDLGVGYRFPRRRGIASLEVRNLFDEDFVFQDDSFRVRRDEPTVSPYIPSRTIMGRITLNF
jgi:tetratricopeptide (TPR) repeat protein